MTVLLDKPPNQGQIPPTNTHIIMRISTQLASLALALTTSLATAGGDGWMTDFEAAKKKATAEKKDLLVDFTGSDWCGWCIKLSDEVFKHDAFKKGVADKYVLVELDFPKDKSKQSEATQKQNAELQKKYKIRGFPSILLMDGEGRPFAQTGYQPGGPETYLTHLEEFRAKRVQRDEALASADKLEGVEKAKALVGVLKTLPENQLSFYSEITDQIAKLDPEDKSGYMVQQKLKEAKTNLQSEVMEAMRGGKPETAPALIDKFIADHNVEGDEKNELLLMKLQINVSIMAQAGETDKALAAVDTYIADNKLEGEAKQNALVAKIGPLMNSKNFDEADKVLDAIIAVAPDSATAKQVSDFKPKLAEMKKAASAPKAPNPAHGQPGHVHGKE